MFSQLVIRVVLATALTSAAVLKAQQFVMSPLPRTGGLDGPVVVPALVALELMLALWLLSGVYAKASWWAALGCFVVFAGVSAHKGLIGEASCGCFGEVVVRPWHMAIADAAAVAALLYWRPTGASARPIRWPKVKMAGMASVAVLVSASVGLAALRHRPAVVAEDGSIPAGQSLVILEPATWSSKKWPLIQHVDVGERLGQGQWLVLLYHSDCDTCREAIPRYWKLAGEWKTRRAGRQVAFVEMPPYHGSGGSLILPSPSYAVGRLSDRYEWFAQTPVGLWMEDGVVRAVAEGREAAGLEWLPKEPREGSKP